MNLIEKNSQLPMAIGAVPFDACDVASQLMDLATGYRSTITAGGLSA